MGVQYTCKKRREKVVEGVDEFATVKAKFALELINHAL
jgi:hypothetical protein